MIQPIHNGNGFERARNGDLAGRFSTVVQDIDQAMSIKFNTMVYDLTRQGQSVIKMSLGEAHFDLPLFPMDGLPFPDLYHYSDSRGIPELRDKLSAYYREEYNVPIDPEREILVTAGSKMAIHMALMSILNPGDEVLIPEPAWVSYKEQIKLCHATAVGIPHGEGLEDWQRHITRRTKAIIVTTPHNPRGYVYRTEDLRYLLDLAAKHGLWVLSDEAYSDFAFDNAFVSFGSLDPDKRHAIVFNSISKNYGISGWRLGYVIGHTDLIDQVLKVNQHLITCPATILAHYVATYFERIRDVTRPQIREVVAKRNRLAEYMDSIGLSYLPGAGTFYFFVSIEPSRLGSEEFCTRLLTEEAVSTVPGVGYGASCDRFIRVSVGTATLEENELGLRKIKGMIERTRRHETAPLAVVGR